MGMTRRVILVTGAAAVGGLVVGLSTSPGRLRREAMALADREGASMLAPWVRIGTDNSVSILVDKLDMGQGSHTGLAMLAAEELGASYDQVSVEQCPIDSVFATGDVILTYLDRVQDWRPWQPAVPFFKGLSAFAARQMNFMITGGSSAIMTGWTSHRLAGASARNLLQRAAAESWGVDPEQCTVAAGRIRHPNGTDEVMFGEVAARAAELEPDGTPSLTPNDEFRIIGTSPPRLDIPAKIAGAATYGTDVAPAGAKAAAIAQTPLPGGTLDSYESATGDGVTLVDLGDALGAVANDWWTANEALKRARPRFVHESLGAFSTSEHRATLQAALGGEEGEVVKEVGEMESLTPDGDISADYFVPFLAHATMEPMSAMARKTETGFEVWTGTQSPLVARAAIAESVGLEPEAIKVNVLPAGGGFGRRAEPDVAVRAVQLVRQTGEDIKLIYSRETDMAAGFYRPAVASVMRGRLTDDGRIAAWDHRFTGVAAEVDLNPYGAPSFRATQFKMEHGFTTGPWRSVDHSQHAFFIESFMDELAAAAGADPFAFRRAHLPEDSRRRKVLDRLEEESNWQGSAYPGGGGRGMALYSSFGSVVGLVCDLEQKENGFSLTRVTAVIDCGTAIRPDSVVAQTEGGILYGLSAALFSEVEARDGTIQTQNFHNYPILRMARSPAIDVTLANTGGPPNGVGEPGTPPAAPALANALAAATGERQRILPLQLALV